MNFSEYRQLDGVALAQLIKQGSVSADEVWAVASKRLDEVNPKLNLLSYDLRSTRAEQQNHAHYNQQGLLYGVPILIKDLLADIAHIPTSSANRILAQIAAEQDSYLIDAYRQSGVSWLGKTTLPEWGLMPYSESDLFGITRNPWDCQYTPGGSSGGSAAAVASGIVPIAHGGDGGGSIRIPASNCGLFGLKPSRGRVPMGPLLMDSWLGMVAEHVLTRSVRDSAVMLDIACTAQASVNLYACPPQREPFVEAMNQSLDRLRIAVCNKPWFGGDVDPIIQAAYEDSVQLLVSLGHNVEEAAPAFMEAEILSRAMMVLVAGETAKIKRHIEQFMHHKIRYQDVEPATWSLIVMGEQLSAGEVLWARDVINQQAHLAAEFHQQYDVLCTPVLPRLTPKVEELALSSTEKRSIEWLFGRLRLNFLMKNNPILERNSQKALSYIGFTAPFNMTGQPAMSVPLYWHNNHLPIGSQFVAAHGREALLLQLAAELEQARPWFHRVPTI